MGGMRGRRRGRDEAWGGGFRGLLPQTCDVLEKSGRRFFVVFGPRGPSPGPGSVNKRPRMKNRSRGKGRDLQGPRSEKIKTSPCLGIPPPCQGDQRIAVFWFSRGRRGRSFCGSGPAGFGPGSSSRKGGLRKGGLSTPDPRLRGRSHPGIHHFITPRPQRSGLSLLSVFA